MLLKYLRTNWVIYSLLLAYSGLLIVNAMGIDIWLPSCPIHSTTGIECFGCGMNHALVDIFSGRFKEAWHHHPMAFIYPVLIAFWIGYDFMKFAKKINHQTL